MIDPTRLAAIQALKPRNWTAERGNAGSEHPLFLVADDLDGRRLDSDDDVLFCVAAADPDYGLQALAAEVERLQGREKPVKLSPTKLMNSNRFIDPPACKCGKLMMDRWSYCPNCGRRLEWK